MKARHASEVRTFTDIPNVGKATAGDFALLGIAAPHALADRDPYQLYEELCARSGQRHDPCVIDVFIACVRFMQGGEPLPWWHYTEERKRHQAGA